jgi:hypothetical protein
VWFDEGVAFAREAIESDGVVLAHCHMGINRGPSMGFAILLALGWDAREALDAIHAARPIAFVAYAEDALRWHHTKTHQNWRPTCNAFTSGVATTSWTSTKSCVPRGSRTTRSREPRGGYRQLSVGMATARITTGNGGYLRYDAARVTWRRREVVSVDAGAS